MYVVREKQTATEDSIKKTQSSFVTSAPKNEKLDENYDIPIIKSNMESVISTPGQNEVITVEDDKSSISNVSTAISDRKHKTKDEEIINNNFKADLKSEMKEKIIQYSNDAKLIKIESLPTRFFEFTLQNGEKTQHIKIYDV